jgi:hypothetical protein
MLGRIEKHKQAEDTLLATLYVFQEQGRKEVSLSEFNECISNLQKHLPLNYSFSERFPFSIDLLSDLRELSYNGYIRHLRYRHDAYLPKTFLVLTQLGKGHAKKILQKLPADVYSNLKVVVANTIKDYKKRWVLWSRQPSGV